MHSSFRRIGWLQPLLLCGTAWLLTPACINKNTNIGTDSNECGDGEVTGPEKCDDGNDESGDGCSSTCRKIESGFECPDKGGECTLLDDESDDDAQGDDDVADDDIASPAGDDDVADDDDVAGEDSADDDVTLTDDDVADDDVADDDVADDDVADDDVADDDVADDDSEPSHCVADLFGHYVLRTDGVLLYEPESVTADEQPILDAETVLPLEGVVGAAVGQKHGCAALDDGTVACWRLVAGGNAVGQLGNGDTDSDGPVFRASRVLVAPDEPLSGVIGLAHSSTQSWSDKTCAITDAGQVYCWGGVAELLNAANSPYAVPLLADGVSPMTGVIAVDITSAGSACLLANEGSERAVYCWGNNGSGQLGQGDTTRRDYPTRVPGLNDPSMTITFGWYATACAVEDGSVRCWGQNGAGATGSNSDNSEVLTPSQTVLDDETTPLSGVVELVGGSTSTGQGFPGSACALLEDRTVKCWGAGYGPHPTNLGVPNVWRLGVIDGKKVRLLTTDGKYHVDDKVRDVTCNAF